MVPVWLLLGRGRLGLDLPAALGRAVRAGGLVVAGLLAVMALQQAEVGRWDGFLLIEAHYRTGLHDPAVTFVRDAAPRPRSGGTPSEAPTRLPAVRYQFLLVTGIVLVAVAATMAARERTRLDLAVLVYTVVFWVAPLVAGGHLAQYRTHLLLLPSVVLLRRLPAVVPAILAVAAAAVAWQMAGLFYHYILV